LASKSSCYPTAHALAHTKGMLAKYVTKGTILTQHLHRPLRVCRRLFIGSMWPITLLALVAGVCITQELAAVSKRSGTLRADRFALERAIQRIVPLVLVATFCLVPSTAALTFRTFLCEPFEYDAASDDTKRYLHEDLSLSCDSNEYKATRLLAQVAILVWPVGVPVMYAGLLWKSHTALSTGIPTPLSLATAFLSGDYTVGAFWWEPLEMCRKLTLTGWVLLVEEDFEQARVLMALLASIAFLALHLSIKPFKRAEDAHLMTMIQVALIISYSTAMALELSTLPALHTSHRVTSPLTAAQYASS
jgi:hypothetical protein